MEDSEFYPVDFKAVVEQASKEGIDMDSKVPQRRVVEYLNNSNEVVCYGVQEVRFEENTVPSWVTMLFTNPYTLTMQLARFKTLEEAEAFKADPDMFNIVDVRVLK